MSLADDVRTLPYHASKTLFISLSHRRSLARLAARSRVTRPVVARFVAGETLGEVLAAIEELQKAGLQSTVDVLGESVTSEELAEAAAARYVETIPALAARGLSRNVSIKLTQMGLDIGQDACRANIGRVIEAARSVDGFVRFDMEDHTKTDETIDLWREAHVAYEGTGIVIQSALRRSGDDVERIIADGGQVRLCKGAYNEPSSVAFPTKREVDASYVRLMERLMLAGNHAAIATHDVRIIRHAMAFARDHALGPERFEFQMLYGVRRDLQQKLVARGYGVRIYVPYGTEWYPYFMRRLAERPANVGFLARSLLHEEALRFRR